MKLQITLNRTRIETCTVECDDLVDAKKKIEALTPDDFQCDDTSYQIEIFDGNKEVTGDIQPFTPKLDI